MKVYKFGGASVRNADGVRNLRKIIDDEQNLFIIVSAMGKTTNALEKVFEGVQKGDRQLSLDNVEALREAGFDVMKAENMELLTVRGYTDELWRKYARGPQVFVRQATQSTVRVVRKRA